MRPDPNHSPSHQRFLRTLSASMHQLAQPLSTMQLTLELALLSPTMADHYQEITEDLLRELRRAVESMQFTAWLARFQQPATDVQETMLGATLESVISDLRRTLESADLQIQFLRPEHEHSIVISPVRLRQMLFYVLQAVQACSQPGDLVRIETQDPPGQMRLRIQNSRRSSDWTDCADPLQVDSSQANPSQANTSQNDVVYRALALAEAIVSNAGGEFSITTTPLGIVADFTIGSENRAGAIGKEVGKEDRYDVANVVGGS